MQKKRINKSLNDRISIDVWLKNQLEKGNGIMARSLICISSIIMIVMFVFILCPANITTNAAENDTIVQSEESQVIEPKSPVDELTIPETSLIQIESETVPTSFIEESTAPIELQELMEDYNIEVYIVSSKGVNVRSIPSTDGEILNTIPYKEKVKVLKKGNGWLYKEGGGFIYENGTSIEEPTSNLVSLGVFKFTAYCSCSKCCGKNAAHGLTASGTRPSEGRTISVDPRVIPLGSKVIINGHEYTSEDTGSGIKGNRIDMYINSHQRARIFGIKNYEVFIYR